MDTRSMLQKKKNSKTRYSKAMPIGLRTTRIAKVRRGTQPTLVERPKIKMQRARPAARVQRPGTAIRRQATTPRTLTRRKQIAVQFFRHTFTQSAMVFVVLGLFTATLVGRASTNTQSYRVAPTNCTGWNSTDNMKTIDASVDADGQAIPADKSATIQSRKADQPASGDPQLKCKSFTLPEDYPADVSIRSAQLVVSLAVQGNPESEDVLVLESSFDGQQWNKLDSFFLTEDMSNATHGGYWTYPFAKLTQDAIGTLQVRARFVTVPSDRTVEVRIDGIALQVDVRQVVSAEALNLPANVVQVEKQNVSTTDEPVVKVEVGKQARLKFLGFKDTTRSVDEVTVTTPEGTVQAASYDTQNITQGTTTYAKLNIHTDKFTRPGKYTAQVTVLQDNKLAVVTTEFTWGVLVINMNRSVYWPGETVGFGMGVLDPTGHTVCDAQLTLTVVAPDGTRTVQTTEQAEKGVKRSTTCGPDNVTDVADYSAEYETFDEGNYGVTLTAKTASGEYTITDTVVVDAVIPYAISRRGSMRIYPPAAYIMTLDVRPQKNFIGVVEDYVPPSFEVISVSDGGKVIKGQQRTTIRWFVDWDAGTTHTLTYRYDAPDISPEIFRLGPVQVGLSAGASAQAGDYQESRQWQIASDGLQAAPRLLSADGKTATQYLRALPDTVKAVNQKSAVIDEPKREVAKTRVELPKQGFVNALKICDVEAQDGTCKQWAPLAVPFTNTGDAVVFETTLLGKIAAFDDKVQGNVQALKKMYAEEAGLPEVPALRQADTMDFQKNQKENIRVQSSNYLNYYDGSSYQPIPEIPSPGEIPLDTPPASNRQFYTELPEWAVLNVSADGQTVNVTDQKGTQLWLYEKPFLFSPDSRPYRHVPIPNEQLTSEEALRTYPNGIITGLPEADSGITRECTRKDCVDEARITKAKFVVEGNRIYVDLPQGLSYPQVLVDDTDTASTNNKDTHMRLSLPTRGYGTCTYLHAGKILSSSYDYRPLMDWTLTSGSGNISNIDVKLYRYDVSTYSGGNSATTRYYRLHELTTAFTEGTTCDSTTTPGATWNTYNGTNNWTSAGGDYSATQVDSTGVSGNGTADAWYTWTLNGAGATNSISGLTWGSTVDFILFNSDDYTTAGNNLDHFYAKEFTGTSSDPYIEITYSTGITVSGVAYTNETGTTLNSSGGAVKLVNSATGATFSDADGTDGSGNWSISSITTPTNGDVFTIWLDGATADGTLVIKYGASCTGSPNCTGLSLYQDRVIFRNEHTGSIANSDLSSCDNNTGANCSDTEIGFTSDIGALTTSSGRELHIWTGDTFDPGGTVATNGTGGDFHVDDSAVAYFDTATSSVGRDILVDGAATLHIDVSLTVTGGDITTSGTSATITYTGTPKVTMSGGTGSIGGGTTPTLAFYNLEVSVSTTISLVSPASVAIDLRVIGGASAVVNINADLTVGNDITMSGGAIITTTAGTPTVTLTCTDNACGLGTSGQTGTFIIYNLTTSGTGTTTLNRGLTVSGSLAVGSGTTLTTANSPTITMSGTTKTISGTGTKTLYALTISGSVSWSAGGTNSVASTFSVSAGGAFTDGADISIAAGLANVGTGTIAYTGTPTLTVTANGTIGGSATGTVQLYKLSVTGGTATIGTASGGVDFDNLVTAATGGTVDVANNLSVGAGLTTTGTGAITGAQPATVTFTASGSLGGNDSGCAPGTVAVAAGTLTQASNCALVGSASVASGATWSGGTKDLSIVAATFDGDGTVTFTGGTVRVNHSTVWTTGTFGGNTAWTFNNLIFGQHSSPTYYANASTTATGSGAITVNGILTTESVSAWPECGGLIDAPGTCYITLDAGSKVWNLTGTGTVFTNAGKLLGSTSTFNYTNPSIAGANVGATNNATLNYYHHVNFDPTGTGNTPTYTLPIGGIVADGNVVIGNAANEITLSGVTNNSAVTILGDVSCGTGLIEFGNAVRTGAGIWTIGGNFTSTNCFGIFTFNTGSTLKMTGSTKTITHSGAIYNLSIDPSAGGGGTINLATTNAVTNIVSIAANDQLTIASTKVLTHNGTTLTLNGTINGPGRYIYKSVTDFPTTGTLAAGLILTFDTTLNSQVMSPRADYQYVEIENSGATAGRTVTLGTAASQTITLANNLTVQKTGATGDVTLTGVTNAPAVNVTGDVSCVASNTKSITMGAGIWTVSGNFDMTNCTTLTTTGNTLVMNGTAKTLTSNSKILNNLTLSGTITLANAVHTVNGNLVLAGTVTPGTSTVTMTGTSNTITGGGFTLYNLTVDPATAGTITLQTSGLTVSNTLNVATGDALTINVSRTLSATGTTTLNGTIDGAGTLLFTSTSSGPEATGTLNSLVRYDASSVDIPATTFDARTYGGAVEFYSAGGAARTITSAASGTYAFSSTVTTTCNACTGGLTLDLDDVATDPTVNSTGALTIGASTTLLAPSSTSLGLAGNYTNNGTFTHNTSTVNFKATGTGKTINNGASSFYNVIFDGAGGAWSPLTNTMTITNDLTLTNGTFDTATGTANVMVNGNVQCGASCGTINMTSTNTFTQSVAASKAFGTNVAVGTNWTFNNLTFTASAGTPTITFNATGTGQTIVGGTLATTNSGTSLVVDNETNDRIIDVNGAVTIGAGTTLQASSTADFNVGGNWTNSGAFTAGTGTVTLDGAAQQTLSGGMLTTNKFNNLIITNASGSDPEASPSVIFGASATTGATFTAATASTKLRFLAGGTYTFQNISFVGGAVGTRVALRSSSTGTSWVLNVAGTRTVTKTDVRDSNACGQVPNIDATDGTNFDSTGNSCWDINTLTFAINDVAVGFGTLTSGGARWANAGATGLGSAVAAHTLAVTTNARNGYALSYFGPTLVGPETIDAATFTADVDGSPGNKQFAMSITTDGNGTIPSAYQQASNNYSFVPSTTTTLMSETGPTAIETASVYYLCNIAATTLPGAYSTNVTYILTGTF